MHHTVCLLLLFFGYKFNARERVRTLNRLGCNRTKGSAGVRECERNNNSRVEGQNRGRRGQMREVDKMIQKQALQKEKLETWKEVGLGVNGSGGRGSGLTGTEKIWASDLTFR